MELVLVVVGALVLLGIFRLFQRIGRAAKRPADPVNRIILMAGGNPSVGGKTADQKFIEKLLKGDGLLAEYAQVPRHNGPARNEATEQMFGIMFSTAADRGEGLIEYYMARHKCGRTEAMQHAIHDREREAKRYD